MHKLHPFLCAINIANYMLAHFKDHIVLPNNYIIYTIHQYHKFPQEGRNAQQENKNNSLSGPPISVVNNIILSYYRSYQRMLNVYHTPDCNYLESQKKWQKLSTNIL